MKRAGAKALDFCRAPESALNIALIFGADPGVVADAATQLMKTWAGGDAGALDVTRFSDDVLKKEPAALADALVARPLLGGVPMIRCKLDGESAAKTLTDTLAAIDEDALAVEGFWLLEGPDLPPKSKIRKAFEASPKAAALHVFADTEAMVEELVQSALTSIGADIDADALAHFIAELPGDRHMANSEIEKLSLYAMDLGRPVALEDVEAVAASEQPKGADAAADAALAGDMASADAATSRFLEAGGSPVSALRTLHFRILRLSDAQAGAKYLRPPVFERDRPAFDRMLKDWPPHRIARGLALLYAAEKTCKQAGAPAEAALKTVIDRLARRKV